MSCATNTEFTGFQSVDRINKYPIVNDSLAATLNCYRWIKSKNRLLESTLSMAESTLKTIKDTTEPFAVPKLKFVDSVVSHQLDRLEKYCPIILEPSATIKQFPEKVYYSSIEPTVDVLIQPLKRTVDTVSQASNKAVSTLSSAIGSSVAHLLPINALIKHSTDTVLNKTEYLLEKYLPEESDSGYEDVSTNKKDLPPYSKLKRLSFKTRRRVYRKAIKEIDFIYKKSMENLEKIRRIFGEIQKQGNVLKSSLSKECEGAVSTVKHAVAIPNSQMIQSASRYGERLYLYTKRSRSCLTKYVSTGVVDALGLVHDKLDQLQTILKNWQKPTFVNDTLINQTRDILDKIEIGIEHATNKLKQFMRQYYEGNDECNSSQSPSEEVDQELQDQEYSSENEDFGSVDDCENQKDLDGDKHSDTSD